LGLPFSQQPADIDETQHANEGPRDYVVRMAQEKAQAIAARLSPKADSIVIGADTTVVVAGQVLGKPSSKAEGLRMLSLLSNRVHDVLTGLCVLRQDRCELECTHTQVWCRTISAAEADHYWATGEPSDKAGGYGIQGIGSIFIDQIQGSYSAVMGLPVATLERLLSAVDYDIWANQSDPQDLGR